MIKTFCLALMAVVMLAVASPASAQTCIEVQNNVIDDLQIAQSHLGAAETYLWAGAYDIQDAYDQPSFAYTYVNYALGMLNWASYHHEYASSYVYDALVLVNAHPDCGFSYDTVEYSDDWLNQQADAIFGLYWEIELNFGN